MKRYLFVVALGVVVFAGGYTIWTYGWEPTAADSRTDPLSRYRAVLRADVNGGQTPQETMRLFAEALERNDLAQAGRYFMPKITGDGRQWMEGLRRTAEEGRLPGVIETLRHRLKPAPQEITHDGDFKFYFYPSGNGVRVGVLDLEFNPFSGVWKIESM